jgi:hypothetical protein
MNCQAVHDKILNLPDPRVVPDALREHIAGCEVCRAWMEQAARLESLLAQLPVSPALGNKKAEMIEDLVRNDPVIIRPLAIPSRRSLADTVLKLLHENRTVMGGLAAAVLVVLGGWWLLTHSGPAPAPTIVEAQKDPFLEKMVRWDVDLAKAKTPADRLQILVSMADGLSTQARSLARVANADDFAEFNRWIDKVKDGIVKQAEKVPMDTLPQRNERREQFDALATKLAEAASQAEKLESVPDHAKPTLQKIARSAREVGEKLQAMAKAG